jgi:hypothetical protein
MGSHDDLNCAHDHCIVLPPRLLHLVDLISEQSSSPRTHFCSAAGNARKSTACYRPRVASALPKLVDDVMGYFSQSCAAQLVRSPLLASRREVAKNSLYLVDEPYRQTEQHALCRHCYMLTVGGGALLDANPDSPRLRRLAACATFACQRRR